MVVSACAGRFIIVGSDDHNMIEPERIDDCQFWRMRVVVFVVPNAELLVLYSLVIVARVGRSR
jgi:hypothetical protein